MRVLVTGRGSIAQRHVRHLRELIPGVEIAIISGAGEIDPVFGLARCWVELMRALPGSLTP